MSHWDTSALAKLCWVEADSEVFEAKAAEPGATLTSARITKVAPLVESLVLSEMNALGQRPKRNANHVGQKVRAVERRTKDHSTKEGCPDPIDPVGMIKL